ncbi:MAG: hypothetical protein ABJC63_03720 [Gemmatimonadales bacterium]
MIKLSPSRLSLMVVVPMAVLALAGAGSTKPLSPPEAAVSAQAEDTITHVYMRNVDFFIDPQIPLHIRRLNGTMRAKTGGPVVFDDKTTFIIHLDAAEVGLTGPGLSLLLNKYVFNYPGAPIKRLTASTLGTHVVLKGTLHKVTDLPFTITSSVSVTSDGKIRVHPIRTEILGLHVDQLMNGLGLALDKIIDLRKAKGASVKGNDILLDPNAILPPPTMEGTITAVRVEGNEIIQDFGGSPQTAILPDSSPANYIFFKGGSIKFGKLLMSDAELEIVDLDPVDPFRFDIAKYLPQLVAGYSRSFASGGLEAFMRDLDKIGKQAENPLTGH